MYGITDSVISVKINNEKLAEKKVTIHAVMSVIQGQNTAFAVGEKIINGKTSNIKVIGDVNSLEKLKELKVGPNVTLGDISTINETKNANFISRFNGKDSLNISITKDINNC